MTFSTDVLEGLSQTPKTIPCTWLYDLRGSELFEQITTLAEYYPTRTETSLLTDLVGEVAQRVGPGASLIELGSGSSIKTRLLLRAMPALASYVPVDISAEYLHEAVASLAHEFPALPVTPLVADFSRPFEMPWSPSSDGHRASQRLGFFPPRRLATSRRPRRGRCWPTWRARLAQAHIY